MAHSMKMIGYARVSTVGQSLEAQIQQLTEHGCDCIFQEKKAGPKQIVLNWLSSCRRFNRGIR